MVHYGFLGAAAAAPRLRVADCGYNAERILDVMARAEKERVSLLALPELVLTGYTCADLFQQRTLLDGALAALEHVERKSRALFSGLAVLGFPLLVVISTTPWPARAP